MEYDRRIKPREIDEKIIGNDWSDYTVAEIAVELKRSPSYIKDRITQIERYSGIRIKYTRRKPGARKKTEKYDDVCPYYHDCFSCPFPDCKWDF